MRKGYDELNVRWRNDWGDLYIDLINYVRTPDGKVKVFTDNGKFISQDCLHLTESGAKWYATMINWDNIFGRQSNF